MKTLEFTVKVKVHHDGATHNQWKDHITTAVRAWGGQYHPSDPLFPTNIESVTVTSRRKQCRTKHESKFQLETDNA